MTKRHKFISKFGAGKKKHLTLFEKQETVCLFYTCSTDKTYSVKNSKCDLEKLRDHKMGNALN
jgi:hypothetical protein